MKKRIAFLAGSLIPALLSGCGMLDWDKIAESQRESAERSEQRAATAKAYRQRDEAMNDAVVKQAYIAHFYDRILPTSAAETFLIGAIGKQTGWAAPNFQTVTSVAVGDSLAVTGGDWRDRWFAFVWKSADGTVIKHLELQEIDARGNGRDPLVGAATYFVNGPTTDDEMRALSRFLNAPGWQFGKSNTVLIRYKPEFQGPGRESTLHFLQEKEAFLDNIIASRT